MDGNVAVCAFPCLKIDMEPWEKRICIIDTHTHTHTHTLIEGMIITQNTASLGIYTHILSPLHMDEILNKDEGIELQMTDE